jgi:hypothetical protein
LKTKTTFLSALREADATLKPDEDYVRDVLLGKTLKALTLLGMDEQHKDVVRQWAQSGSFMIGNEWQGLDEQGNFQGAYARLAHAMSKQQRFVGMNLPISYALGNKEYAQNVSQQEMLAATRDRVNSHCANPAHSEILACIRRGDAIREERIRARIEEKVPLPLEDEAHRQDARKDARGILSYLPDTALKLLAYEDYTLAYADNQNINPLVPKERLPGINVNLTSTAGYRQGRYNTIFLSNGWHKNPDILLQDESLRYKSPAQTLLHETMHIAMSYMFKTETGRKESQALKQALDDVNTDLFKAGKRPPEYLQNYLDTINSNTFLQIISPENKSYNDYNKKGDDTRWQEVVCNLYGLIHTEYPYPGTGKNNPYLDIPSLGVLAEKINAYAGHAFKLCRTEHTREEARKIASSPSR